MKMFLSSSSDDEDDTDSTPSSETTRVNDEIQRYTASKRLSNEKDPIRWWGENQNAFPLLSKLARQYLACPPVPWPASDFSAKPGKYMMNAETDFWEKTPRSFCS